ncbi:MAG: ATP-binding protein, partial [Candidatus Zixiibacteriota bacterium]
DIIGLVFRDGSRQFLCRLGRESLFPYKFEQISSPDRNNNALAWSTDKNGPVEQLCRDIISKKIDSSNPYFTAVGSFWTGDINNIRIENFRLAEEDDELGINLQKDYRSVAIVPIDIGHDRVGLLELRSKSVDFFNERLVALFEQMGRTIGNALTHRRLHVALRERVKELTCLYGISKLVQKPNISLDFILQETVKLLPPAWLYPEIASAQIVVDDQAYITANFGKAVHQMKADIIVNRKKRGFVEIRYSSEKPPLDDGPFLREERNLIDTLVQELSIIIEQLHAEDEKLRLQEQLRHADRLATMGQLVAAVAHELNEPLANILGFAQLASKDFDLKNQVKNDLIKIVDSALHAREVIQKLLMSAKDVSMAKTKFNINNLINDGLYFLRSRCVKSGIELTCNLSDDLPFIYADRSQMMQVLTNLVVNAVQAMPHGGRLIITTEKDDGFILLLVEDSGTGMTDEVLEKIFDPFFTTKDSDQGTGLGLPIVQGILTSHGGDIKVESEVGSGTKFVIRLPLET